jgi:hypothetical protein
MNILEEDTYVDNLNYCFPDTKHNMCNIEKNTTANRIRLVTWI